MNQNEAAPARQNVLGAAIAGGIIGSLVTAALLFFAMPNVLSSRIVRDGLIADPAVLLQARDALLQAQYAPVLAANRAAIETPFASSWKGAPKPDVTLVEFFDYNCPFCKASAPNLERLAKTDGKIRVIYKDLSLIHI